MPSRALAALYVLTALLACGRDERPPRAGSAPTATPEATATPRLLPDLKITDVKVEPKPHVVQGLATFVRGKNYTIRFEVTNVGQGPLAGAAVVSVDYRCQGPGLGSTGNKVSAGSNLAPAARQISAQFAFSIPADRLPGTCRFTFKVDPDNVHEESDESNNVWLTTVNIH